MKELATGQLDLVCSPSVPLSMTTNTGIELIQIIRPWLALPRGYRERVLTKFVHVECCGSLWKRGNTHVYLIRLQRQFRLVVINLRKMFKTEVMAWVMECYGNVVDRIPCGIFFSELNQSVQVVGLECNGENHGLHS